MPVINLYIHVTYICEYDCIVCCTSFLFLTVGCRPVLNKLTSGKKSLYAALSFCFFFNTVYPWMEKLVTQKCISETEISLWIKQLCVCVNNWSPCLNITLLLDSARYSHPLLQYLPSFTRSCLEYVLQWLTTSAHWGKKIDWTNKASIRAAHTPGNVCG